MNFVIKEKRQMPFVVRKSSENNNTEKVTDMHHKKYILYIKH